MATATYGVASQMLYPLSYERSHCSILHSDLAGAC